MQISLVVDYDTATRRIHVRAGPPDALKDPVTIRGLLSEALHQLETQVWDAKGGPTIVEAGALPNGGRR